MWAGSRIGGAHVSQQDVNTMRSAYEAFDRADIPAVLSAFDPSIEWNEPGGGRAPSGTFHGSESVGRDVFATIPQNFEEFRAEPDQFIDAGDHLVVVGHFRGKAKGGQQVDLPFAHLWVMRAGKAASFHNYPQADAWAKAWGG
jgi:ketosteroid isomerase-like protein